MRTERLIPGAGGVARAVALLGAGDCVALPTETVYGLAADATDGAAVARIFEAKGRPSFNPLIAHVPDLDAARALVAFPDWAETLAARFWPGALTLVLPMTPGAVHPLVTAGLDTLAVRVPSHPLAVEVLRAFGRPLAMPSANLSGRISPTTADHVLASLGGRIAAVLDGGACPVGVESTIVGGAGTPALLREGEVTREEIEALIGPLSEAGAAITAPGQLASHYAPDAGVRLEATEARDGEVLLGFGPVRGDLSLSDSGDLREAAANLYGHLHRLDALKARTIAVAPIPERGLGRAINDRLRRAAAPRD